MVLLLRKVKCLLLILFLILIKYLELKQQIRIAHMQLDNQKDLLAIT